MLRCCKVQGGGCEGAYERCPRRQPDVLKVSKRLFKVLHFGGVTRRMRQFVRKVSKASTRRLEGVQSVNRTSGRCSRDCSKCYGSEASH